MNGYYSNPQVRARMLEFLGGDSLSDATCHYLTAGDAREPRHRQPRPVAELPVLWENDWDISRSLWDRESLLVHLDIEYVNFDFPAEPYLEPERIFDLQHSVELVVTAVLLDYGIVPLHLLSGRGHHFVWRVRQNSPAFESLARLGQVAPTLKRLNARPHRPNGEVVVPELGAAFAGLALVMEYLAHRIKEEAAPMCALPVELTAVEVGPGRFGREMISIDISEYGDPLSTRVIRVPFSSYLKPWQQRGLLGEKTVKQLPPLYLIPLHDMDSQLGLRVMRDQRQVIALAASASAKTPDQSSATENLVSAYQMSALREFHDWFYAQAPEPPDRWPETYDQTPLEPIPCCARYVLEHPNDLLLRPALIERLVRVLLSLGWHPRHIAGLIRSKFERDWGWGERWNGYDPATRAEFYTRLFAGLFVTGRDDLVDFNCQSAKEERLCLAAVCPFNLETYKQSLLDRRTYERLACRPFHRLFLPEEHL
jgi:hypothetical protein